MALALAESRPATKEEKKKASYINADSDWLCTHSENIWKKHKGKYIAVAKRTLCIGNSYEEAVQKAKDRYPKIEPLTRHIPYKRRLWVL